MWGKWVQSLKEKSVKASLKMVVVMMTRIKLVCTTTNSPLRWTLSYSTVLRVSLIGDIGCLGSQPQSALQHGFNDIPCGQKDLHLFRASAATGCQLCSVVRRLNRRSSFLPNCTRMRAKAFKRYKTAGAWETWSLSIPGGSDCDQRPDHRRFVHKATWNRSGPVVMMHSWRGFNNLGSSYWTSSDNRNASKGEQLFCSQGPYPNWSTRSLQKLW